MQDVQTAEFPAKDPTTRQLAQRLKRQTQRQQQAIAAAKQQAASAHTLGLVGSILGAVGLLAAVAVGVVVVGRRR